MTTKLEQLRALVAMIDQYVMDQDTTAGLIIGNAAYRAHPAIALALEIVEALKRSRGGDGTAASRAQHGELAAMLLTKLESEEQP